jgi:uncharacterized phage-associated protein
MDTLRLLGRRRKPLALGKMTYYNNGTQLTVISSPLLEKKLADL